ncbi:Phenylacetyl-CoA ligase [Mycena indigotica]|uniref:Phenylacetyl-CoA ligase n=1 Tax=Mycena indigotica TaxID=2126181 RepID=A0A8H6SJZ1_9AGAR|nr:Phenylacetyl-CoA ligase [Mycena indigotica]KAF7299230.1 Phenylacetyl-CoA ligase [Mycena indigotica]
MPEIRPTAAAGELPPVPDHLTIPQFMLDSGYVDTLRPKRPGHGPFLIDDASGRKVSLDELRDRTQALANVLSSVYSIGEEDVVLVFSRNHLDYPVVLWATHRLGGIVSPANPDFNHSELEYQLKATQAKLLIIHPEAVEAATTAAKTFGLPTDRILVLDVDNVKPPKSLVNINSLIKKGSEMKPVPERILKPGEGKTKLALLSFSSGTTGRPKAVAIPHTSLIANVLQVATHSRLQDESIKWEDRRYRPGDVCIGVLPLYHIYGLVFNLHFMLYCSIDLVIVPKFNFEAMLKSVVRHRITHLIIVPPQAILLCKHPAMKKYKLDTVRTIMTGAAPLSDEVNQMLFKLFPDAHIGQGYGMTETCTVVSLWPITRKRGQSGSAGELIPGVIARVLKPDGTLGGYNEIGELMVKVPSAALAYYNNPQATKETFIDGWVRTGDEVRITPDGELWIVDRLKEIMKVRGFQVAPSELEGTLLDHPDVSDVCVVGIPDDYSGEVPLAFVVLSADAAARVKKTPAALEDARASIINHIRDNKIAYKHLAGGVEFMESIPKTASGKLLRRVLRDKAKELRKGSTTTRAKL